MQFGQSFDDHRDYLMGHDDSALENAPRLHSDLTFKSDSGKANFVLSDSDIVKARNAALAPASDELWVLLAPTIEPIES